MRKITLNIATSPHVMKGTSTDTIMKNVVYALLPAVAFGVYAFGWNALLVMMDPVAPVSKMASVGRVRALWPVLTDDWMMVTAQEWSSSSVSYIFLNDEW